jgi:hypothetical protein
MNINRHNYEEVFILYMDNELSSDDRRMVEAFVLQHPDLKEELDLLLQYKMSPDTGILFPGKEELIKVNGETPITISNYEEWLVLYIDNELNAAQIKEVEKFVVTNPSVQKELVLLQHTKLQSEQIIFANKSSLYRKEENPDSYRERSVPLRWWRVAAAAVLLLGIGITAAVVINKRPAAKADIVKGDGTEKKTETENPVITPVKKENTPVKETAVADNVQQIFTPAVKQNNKNTVVKNNNLVIKDKLPARIQSSVKKEEPVVFDNNKPSNNLPQPLNNPTINKNNAANDAVVNINPRKETINTKESLTIPPVTKPPVVTSPPENPDVSFASLEEGGKNKKNRGLLRKVARTFEKRTNMTATDNDRLLVGGLAFKLK